MSKVHDLINYERKRRGIPTAYWSREMARLAQSQANYCARVGRLVHSSRYAFQGGENLAEGGSNFTPRAIIDCWLHSNAGHREYLLSPRVRKMGVGIAKSKGKTYVAWAFSDQPPTYPDCPYYKPQGLKGRHISGVLNRYPAKLLVKLGGKPMGKRPIRLFIILFLGFFGALGIVLGAHGIYVYFNRIETLLGGEASKLFLTLDVPIRLREVVVWASLRGLQSWIIPALLLVGGIWLWNYSRVWDIISNILDKLKLK